MGKAKHSVDLLKNAVSLGGIADQGPWLRRTHTAMFRRRSMNFLARCIAWPVSQFSCRHAGYLVLCFTALLGADMSYAQDNSSSVVGTWKLVSVETRMTDGRSYASFGENPEGYVIYSADGFMSVTMQYGNRPHFVSQNAREASLEEKASVSDTFSAYAGRYELLPGADTVIHHIDVSSNPNWNGVQQVRRYQIDADQLTLSNKQPIADSISYLIWKRVK